MLEAENKGDKKIIEIIIEMVRKVYKRDGEKTLKELKESKKIGINYNM